MRLIKQGIQILLHSAKLMVGFTIYLVLKKTPPFAYQSMVSLFCLTRGYSNDFLSRLIGLFSRPHRFSNADGILGNMAEKTQIDHVVSALREYGFYVFENRLPDELCDRLLQYATSHPCKMRPMDGDQSGKPVATIYHRGAPQSVRYDFDTQDLLDNHDVQKILADLSFAAVAQDYLGARPVIDVLGMWWHTAFSDKPDSEAAQYFHFDMDRPKWLKFFIYLTDVETTNGPHTFVAGSHKTGSIPSSLLRKGYARLIDEEVKEVFNRKDIIEFVAPRGTIIAEDTRGLHKGKHAEKDDRLILQVQFSNSLFGGYYPKASLGNDLCVELKNNVRQYQELYAAYLQGV
jgi:hypothetical protein